MQGRFSFDVDGIASVIAAPSWSRGALDAVQRSFDQMSRVLRDTSSYSDARAEAFVDRRLNKLETTIPGATELTGEVRRIRKTTTRQKLGIFLGAVAVAIQTISALPGAISATQTYVAEVIDWAGGILDQGIEPDPRNAPAPHSSGSPGRSQ